MSGLKDRKQTKKTKPTTYIKEIIIMARIYKSADELIGKTPLLELTHIEKEFSLKAKILAKLEYFNPAGSVKDRIAKAQIRKLHYHGRNC